MTLAILRHYKKPEIGDSLRNCVNGKSGAVIASCEFWGESKVSRGGRFGALFCARALLLV